MTWANRALICGSGSWGAGARGGSACCGEGGGWARASNQITAIRDVFKGEKKQNWEGFWLALGVLSLLSCRLLGHHRAGALGRDQRRGQTVFSGHGQAVAPLSPHNPALFVLSLWDTRWFSHRWGLSHQAEIWSGATLWGWGCGGFLAGISVDSGVSFPVHLA